MRAWGAPDKYVQGRKVLLDIERYVGHLGEKFSIIMDPIFTENYQPVIKESLCCKNKDVEFYEFVGEITKNQLAKFTQIISHKETDVVVAIGGGKLIDVGKNVAHHLQKKLVICPTIASTDAPTSAMSIIYTDDNEFDEIKLYYRNPDLVLVDSDLISKAPIRFLIAGMGDALSTYFEGEANRKFKHNNYVLNEIGKFESTISGRSIAYSCYQTILDKGLEALDSIQNNITDEAVEDVIESNILMSGIGFENVGCSVAHAIGNGMTALPSGESMLHGERVAFGVICQLLNDNVEKSVLDTVLNFMNSISLPLTLDDLGMSEQDIPTIARAALKEASILVSPRILNVENVSDLIRKAHAMGASYKK